jgi:transcriptional regulator with XRE-family HTH domain
MTRETDTAEAKPRRLGKPLLRSEDPEFYEGLGRAIKVARTAMGLERKELAEAAGVSYAYLSDIETGRGRPGSRSFLSIAQALGRSPSELMREAEVYRARITGEAPPASASMPAEPEPELDLDTMIRRYSDAAPSPTARRWFHAGRALAGAQLGEPSGTDAHLGRSASVADEPTPIHDELRSAISQLSPEDAAVVLALVRRLGRGG